jgi:hypothetical protein
MSDENIFVRAFTAAAFFFLPHSRARVNFLEPPLQEADSTTVLPHKVQL